MLPLPDLSVDRFLAVHAIEMSDALKPTLREIWRVLRPEGRVLIVVPNRRSIWARREGTPFGQGQPYSRGQLEQLVTGSMFAVEACSFVLALPPVDVKPMWLYAPQLERLGLRLWPAFSGAILLEASKQISAMLPKGKLMPVGRRYRIIPAGAAAHNSSRPASYHSAARKQKNGLRSDEIL